jgi:dipeptidyl aminopeptidase/acylaminoacyl peptidase
MLLAERHSFIEPSDLYLVTPGDSIADTKVVQITEVNKDILDQMAKPTVEQRWVKTTDGKEMLTWVILPPHFDASKKYPTLLFCEGGPQSAVSQFWSIVGTL